MSKNKLLGSEIRKYDKSTWPPEAKLCVMLSELGTLLSKSLWWERYMEVSGRMGHGCPVSATLAVKMFKDDELSPNILDIVEKLADVHKEIIDGRQKE